MSPRDIQKINAKTKKYRGYLAIRPRSPWIHRWTERSCRRLQDVPASLYTRQKSRMGILLADDMGKILSGPRNPAPLGYGAALDGATAQAVLAPRANYHSYLRESAIGLNYFPRH